MKPVSYLLKLTQNTLGENTYGKRAALNQQADLFAPRLLLNAAPTLSCSGQQP